MDHLQSLLTRLRHISPITAGVAWVAGVLSAQVIQEIASDPISSKSFPAYMFIFVLLIYGAVIFVAHRVDQHTHDTLAEVQSLARTMGTVNFVSAHPQQGGISEVYCEMVKLVRECAALDVISYLHDPNTLADADIVQSDALREYYQAIEDRVEQAVQKKRNFRYRRIFLYAPTTSGETGLKRRATLQNHLERVLHVDDKRIVNIKEYAGPPLIQTSYGIFYQDDTTSNRQTAIMVWEVDAFRPDPSQPQGGKPYILGLASFMDVRGHVTENFNRFFENFLAVCDTLPTAPPF